MGFLRPRRHGLLVGLSFDRSTNRNAVSAATSYDGGKSWTNQQTIVAYTTAQFFTDKNSTTADPIHAGTAYTVWDTLISPTDQPDDRVHAAAYTGPAEFSRATGSRPSETSSWSTPRLTRCTTSPT